MSFLKSIFSPERREQLDQGLETSKKSFFSKLGTAIAGKSKIDTEVLDELEEVLIRSDVGVDTTLKIIDSLTSLQLRSILRTLMQMFLSYLSILFLR